MRNGIHVRIQAGDKLAGTRRYHGDAGRQQRLVAERPDQRHDAVRRPRAHEQEANGDGRLGDTDLCRFGVGVGIGAQRFDVHLLGLLAQCLLVAEYMAHDLAVVVDNQRHRDEVAEGEDDADEEARVEGVGQVVKGARGEISLWKNANG